MDSLIPSNIRNLLINHHLEVASEGPWEDLVCTLCGKLSMNAYQTFCGCTFCRRCIKRRLEGIDEMCPGGKVDCQMEGLVFDRNVNRSSNLILRISRLKVVCPNDSCRVVAEVSQMKAHMDVCPERPIDCPFGVLGCTSSGRVSSRRMKTHIIEEAVAHSQMMMERFGEIHMYTNEDTKLKIKLTEKQKNDRIDERSEMNEELKGEVAELKSRMEEAVKALTDKMDVDRKELRKMKDDIDTVMTRVLIPKTRYAIRDTWSKIMKTETKAMKRKMEKERVEAIKTKDEAESLKADVVIKSEESKIIKDEMESLDMTKEDDKIDHLKDITTTVSTLQEEREMVNQLKGIVHGLNIGRNKVVAVGKLSVKVDKFTSRMNDEDSVYSPYFYTHSNGYKLRLEVYPGGYDEGRGSHMSVFISICRGEYDDVLPWPCKYLISVAVVNQRTNEAHVTDTIGYCSIFKDGFTKPTNRDYPGCGWPSFISHEDLLSIEGLMVDESVLLQITVSLPPVDIASFKVDKFKQKMAANEIIYSPYFYTHSNGYKLRLIVIPGGYNEGSGSHMSVCISICKGEYDDVLSWPCKYLITVAVVNQRTNEAHATHSISYSSIFKDNFIKPTNGDNPARGLTKFISHKDLLSFESLQVKKSVLLQIAATPPL